MELSDQELEKLTGGGTVEWKDSSLNVGRYHRKLCDAYHALGRYDEALAAARRGVILTRNDLYSHFNLALVHYDRLQLDDAIRCAEKALTLDPEFALAHFHIAAASLLKGDFARGWEEYRWRMGRPGAVSLGNRPEWDGRPLGHRPLLLVADQGLGDIIQFTRYIEWAARRSANIIVRCRAESEPIKPTLLQQRGLRRLWLDGDEPSDFVAWAPLSGLPRLAATRIDTIPDEIPYVRAVPEKLAAWVEQLDGRLPRGHRRVGIVWAGRPTHGNDHDRSVTLATLAPLGELSKVALVSLQKGAATAELEMYRGRAPVLNLGDEINDFADTAAILENLDVLVTVDTSVAHLAGAMGKRVWIMLAFAPDWRWLLDRRDSPWYPTARLFRQPAPGQWGPAIHAITEELERTIPTRQYSGRRGGV